MIYMIFVDIKMHEPTGLKQIFKEIFTNGIGK